MRGEILALHHFPVQPFQGVVPRAIFPGQHFQDRLAIWIYLDGFAIQIYRGSFAMQTCCMGLLGKFCYTCLAEFFVMQVYRDNFDV
jgi:hypothetical protein